MKYLYKNIKLAATLLVILLTTNSCSEEFLEVEIKGNLIAEEIGDYNLLLEGRRLYQYFSPIIFPLSPEVCMLEPFNSPGNGDLEILPAFQWKGDIYQPDEDIDLIQEYLSNLYAYNKVINEVLNANGASETEKLNLQAEARANRAWSYFMLINFFGKPYDPNTAATDLGFPIITEADITQTDFTRATVQEVYDFILDDLNTAMPNLPDLYSRYRMSKGGAKAFLGKVHIFMGNYSEGLAEINAAFDDFANSSLEVGLYDYNVETLPGGALGPGFLGPALPGVDLHIENPYVRSHLNIDGGFSAEILLSPDFVSLFGPSDIRFTTFLVPNAGPFSPPFTVPNFYRKTGTILGFFGANMPDLYLLRAECRARANDLTGAIADLEFLRQHRMPLADVPVPTGLSQNDLLSYIMDERVREFAVQGMEWFTTRRLSTDPLFSSRTYTHTIYNADGTVKETFTLTPERLTLRFNQKLLNQNPEFVNNP